MPNKRPSALISVSERRLRHLPLGKQGEFYPYRRGPSFATLDLLSQCRAEMVVGRGSSTGAFPLFGFRLEDYDSLFAEKLELLLKIRENEFVTWSGSGRALLPTNFGRVGPYQKRGKENPCSRRAP